MLVVLTASNSQFLVESFVRIANALPGLGCVESVYGWHWHGCNDR